MPIKTNVSIDGSAMPNKSLKTTLRWLLIFFAGLVLGALPFGVYFLLSSGGNDASSSSATAPPTYVYHEPTNVRRDGIPVPEKDGKSGIRVYFDSVHGAAQYMKRDNRRYRSDIHAVSGGYRFQRALQNEGFSVHVEDADCFDAAVLDKYNVYISGEQTYEGRFMTDAERQALLEWVERGGGLFLTVGHTNERHNAEVFNTLAATLPVKARFDTICDQTTADPESIGWILLPKVASHPVTEGVKYFSLNNGCSLDTKYGILSSAEDSWSDRFDPNHAPLYEGNKRKDNGELGGPLVGVAAFEYGKGRVVVVGDQSPFTNLNLYMDDHHRFAMNAVRWLAHAENRTGFANGKYKDGYDLLVHTGIGSEFNLYRNVKPRSFRTAYGYLTKEPQLRPWATRTLRTDGDALILAAPTDSYTYDDLDTIEGMMTKGKPVIWLATLASIESAAGRQLAKRFGFHFDTTMSTGQRHTQPFQIHGSYEWTHAIFRTFVPRDIPQVHVQGLTPVVQMSLGTRHIADETGGPQKILIDLVSTKEIGKSKLYVIAPFDLFSDVDLASLYHEGPDVARQQTAELFLRTVKNAIGDTTVYLD